MKRRNLDRHTQKEDGHVKTEYCSIMSTSQEHQRFPANNMKLGINKEKYLLSSFMGNTALLIPDFQLPEL